MLIQSIRVIPYHFSFKMKVIDKNSINPNWKRELIIGKGKDEPGSGRAS